VIGHADARRRKRTLDVGRELVRNNLPDDDEEEKKEEEDQKQKEEIQRRSRSGSP
jgi:hypothetical protein